MKHKHLITLCIFSFFFTKLISQNAYYDAITISQNLDTTGHFGPRHFPLLRKYFPNKTDNEIALRLSQNPFLSNYFDPNSLASKLDFLKGKSVIAGIGGLDVTSIADGLARFLIKRGKEELNIAFFQKMKKFLDENIEAKTLFPATSAFLGNIASYRYAELLQSLREAFHRDLKNLIVNLNLLIDLPKYQELLSALPEIRVAIRSAKIVSELSRADSALHPANLIHHLAYLNEWHEMDMNLENSWKLLDIISESVRKRSFEIDTTVLTNTVVTIQTREVQRDSTISDTVSLVKNFFKVNTTRIPRGTLIIDSIFTEKLTSRFDTTFNGEVAWIRYLNFHDNILRKSVALKIYLGLLYEKLENVSFRIHDTTVLVQQFMKAHVNDIFTIADLIENFLVMANDVEQSIKEIKAGSLSNDDYYTYIDKAINLVEYGFKVANTIKPDISSDRYIVMARNANNLFRNIYTKNYNAAIMNGYLILREVLSKSEDAVKDKKLFLESSGTSSARDSFQTSNALLVSNNFFAAEEQRSKTVEKILKYGNLMAGIVKSETPEEAESAIESAALPAGSSSIKKNSDWNISLNAYIGGYYSNYTNDVDKIDGSNSKVGITAPIGIAFSKGLGHFRNGSSIGALSAYITVIDVGAIAGYRLNDDSTALEQKITIDDIFAPGAYLVYGLGLPFLEYVPLSIGYGYQYGSKLYFKQQDGSLGVSGESRWRGNWFVAIDVPLANFWTKDSRNKK